MTLLLSWLGVDHRRPGSLYVASDSRFSWGKVATFDYGKKVFCFKNSADILGYCGDVLFPSIVLNQIIELEDKGLLFDSEANCDTKFFKVKNYLQKSFQIIPKILVWLTIPFKLSMVQEMIIIHFTCILCPGTETQMNGLTIKLKCQTTQIR